MPRSKRDFLGIPKPPYKPDRWARSGSAPPQVETMVHIFLDERKKFPSLEEAEAFVTEFNSENTDETVPDWYMRAEVVR